MRNPGRLAAGTLLTWLLLAPTAVSADAFSDFRIPDHRVFGADMNLSGTLAKGHTQQDPGSTSARNDAGAGRLDGRGFWWHDSERGYSSLNGSAHLDGSRFSNRSRSDYYYPLPFPAHTFNGFDDLRRDTREMLFLSGDLRRYPWTPPVAVAFSWSALSLLAQSWNRQMSTNRYEDPTSTGSYLSTSNNDLHAKSLDLSIGVTAGYGRVRDATGVYQARMLEHRVRDLDVLKQPLSATGAGKLATLFYVQSGFNIVHDRPDKFFWREVEKVLREDGALTEQGLDAYALLRIIEPLFPERRVLFTRRSGCFAGLAVTNQQRHQDQRQTNHTRSVQTVDSNPPVIDDMSSSSRLRSDDNFVLVGPQAEMHRPIGMRWQVDANANAGLAVLKNSKVDEAFQLNSFASVTYEISDRWQWTAQTEFRRDYVTRPTGRPESSTSEWGAAWSASLDYFLEDHVLLTLGVWEQQARYRNSAPAYLSSNGVYSREDRVQLGVSYRFLGGLDAPGVIAPVQLMPRGN